MHALMLAVSLLAAGASDDLVRGLVKNAWYWQARARSDKAEDAWKQVREAAPDNPDALAALGGFDARAGRLQQAREALTRLEKVSPNHPDLPVLRREIELGARLAPMLADARKLVHEGRQGEGAAKYRELFGRTGPPGDLALEYYQSIGGSPGGWEEARTGLSRVIQRAPDEPRYKVALGKLLTYREDTRRQGIDMLGSLAKDPTVGREATAAERQALLWLAPTQADLPLLRAYARAHPSDAEIARAVDRARKAGVVKEGFAALDHNDLAKAEKIFRGAGDDPEARRGLGLIAARRNAETKRQGFAALDRGDVGGAERLFSSLGDDADARLGLALVAQKQGAEAQRQKDFVRARQLLLRSRELAPQRPDIWQAPLQDATFWGLIHDAEVAQEHHQDDQAEALLTQAIAEAPKGERWNADLALANLAFNRGEKQVAESHYRDVLSQRPDQPEALRALAVILVNDRRFEEAIPVNDRLARVAPQRAYSGPWLRAEQLRTSARKSLAGGEPMRARALLTEARQIDPGDGWVLHDLANVLLEAGAVDDAAPVVAELVKVAPDDAETKLTQARLLAAQGKGDEALALLRPLELRDPGAIALRRRLELQVRIPPVLALARTNRSAAREQLGALERRYGSEPELAAQIAVAWSKMGDRDRAVALMRSAMAKAPGATRGARLELAAALLQAGDDETLGQILGGLEREPHLTAQERHALGELRIAHAVRVADRAREAGDDRAATETLEPLVREYPNDPRILGALARLEEHRDAATAYGLFRKVLASNPRDADARRGAVDTALALRHLDDARVLADEGEKLRPQDPRARLDQAHVALAEGDDGGAMGSLQDALSLSRSFEIQPSSSSDALAEGREERAAYSGDAASAIRPQILREMDEIRARHRPGFSAEGGLRRRDGEAGLSRLDEYRATASVDVPVRYTARVALHVSELWLDAGTPALGAAPRFGTGAATVVPQTTRGTELLATIDFRNFGAWLGTSPLGFPVFSFLGGARGHVDAGPVGIGAQVSRRSISESLLSWAGVTDPGTGRRWGGVVMDGGKLDLSLQIGPATLFTYGELGRVIGLNVADNVRYAGGGGIELTAYRGSLGEIRAGPAVAALGFDKNLRFFTFGQGGYFSPQRFVHGGLLFEWRRSGTVHWEAVVEPGYDYFQEAVSPAFPGQADQRGVSPYLGRTQDGFSFNGHAMLGFQIAPGVETGLSFAAQQAPEFQEIRGGIVLKIGGAR